MKINNKQSQLKTVEKLNEQEYFDVQFSFNF